MQPRRERLDRDGLLAPGQVEDGAQALVGLDGPALEVERPGPDPRDLQREAQPPLGLHRPRLGAALLVDVGVGAEPALDPPLLSRIGTARDRSQR
jgi:hypothetical protein